MITRDELGRVLCCHGRPMLCSECGEDYAKELEAPASVATGGAHGVGLAKHVIAMVNDFRLADSTFEVFDELMRRVEKEARAVLDKAPPVPLPDAAPSPWRTMTSAPRDASWIIAKFKDGDVRRVHFAEDLSGSEQPAFKGWFYKAGSSFYPADEPVGWMPDPPASAASPAPTEPK